MTGFNQLHLALHNQYHSGFLLFLSKRKWEKKRINKKRNLWKNCISLFSNRHQNEKWLKGTIIMFWHATSYGLCNDYGLFTHMLCIQREPLVSDVYSKTLNRMVEWTGCFRDSHEIKNFAKLFINRLTSFIIEIRY